MKRSYPSTFCETDSAKPAKSVRVSSGRAPPHAHVSPTPQQSVPSPFYPSPSPISVDLRRVMDEFIVIYERLDTSDDPLVKPNYSYTELVYLALLRSPNFCLPINEIYRYIQAKFQFFKRNTREHWRNAVRHSLSKTKCFTKIGVRRGPNSAGTYNRSMFLWTFYPSSIVNFARGDYRPNVDKESGTNTLRWGYYRINAGEFWDRVSIALEAKMSSFKQTLSDSPTQAQIFESQVCMISTEKKTVDNPVSSSTQADFTRETPTTVHAQATASRPVLHTLTTSALNTDAGPKTSAARSITFPAVQSCQVSPRFPGHTSPIHGQSTSGYLHFIKTSHSLCQTSSTPVQNGSGRTTTGPRSSKSWETFCDNLVCNPPTKLSPCVDSESDLSWTSCHDSGVGTDVSSRDNSYLQSFIDGREFHSPPQNVNIFSATYKPQSSTGHHSTSEAINCPNDTFNDVQLLSEDCLSSLFDLSSPNQDCAGQARCSVKAETEPSFTTSHDEYFLPSCQYACPVTTSTSTSLAYSAPNSSCMYSNGYSRNTFDFLETLDDGAFSYIDNLASYSH